MPEGWFVLIVVVYDHIRWTCSM